MNKLVFVGCLVLTLLASCEKEGGKTPPNPGIPDAVPYGPRVGYEEAYGVARAAARLLYSDPEACSTFYGNSYAVEHASTGTKDTLLYVFRFEGGGFAVIATDRRVNRLLTVVEKGSYTPVRSTPRNMYSGFDLYMSAAIDYLEGLHATPDGFDRPSEPGRLQLREEFEWRTVTEPKIPVTWGQKFPYYGYCPYVDGQNADAGFAATAVAQIMAAYSLPQTMQLTYPGAEISSIALNWPGILLHVNSKNDTEECPEHRAIAHLCREIGQQIDMRYGKKQSTGDFAAIPALLQRWGFKADPAAGFTNRAVGEGYAAGTLCCMRGLAADGMDTYEFVWAVDGVREMVSTSELWFIPDRRDANRLLESQTRRARLLYCNWGRDGYMNGYFSPDIFDPENPDRVEPATARLRVRNFSQSVKIITGIKPQQ